MLVKDENVTDHELNFNGVADSAVYDNWKARLDRMKKMKSHFGKDYPKICNELLLHINSEKHSKQGNVVFIVARKV